VAIEPEIQAQGRQVVISREKLQRSRQPQPQLIAIQGDPFNLLEYLREVHRGTPNFGRDLGKRPSSCRIAREYEFRPVGEPLSLDTRTWNMGGSYSQGSLGECQREALRFQRFRNPLTQAVPQQRDEHLSPWIDPQTLPPEDRRFALA
jgi:hypothetical protein